MGGLTTWAAFPGTEIYETEVRWFGIPLLIATFGAIAIGWFERRGRELFAASDMVLALCGIVAAIYLVAIYGTAARNSVGTPFVPIGVAFAATAGSAMILELTRRVAGLALVIITGVFLAYTFTAHLLPGILAVQNAYTWQRFFGLRLHRCGHPGADDGGVVDLHHPLHHLRRLPAGLQGGRLFRQLRLRRGGPRARRTGQGGDLRLRPDGHDQRHLGGQRGGHRVAHHPADEEGRLPQADRGRDRGCGLHRRADHAADHGRGRLHHGRDHRHPLQEIAIAAIIPAVLYFASIYFMVDFEAAKLGMRGMREDELPKFKEMAKQVYLFLPIIILIVALFMGYSVIRAGTLATAAAAAVVSWLLSPNRCARWGRGNIPLHFPTGLQSARHVMSIQIIAVCACAGIIVGVISLTGVGARFSSLLLGPCRHQPASGAVLRHVHRDPAGHGHADHGGLCGGGLGRGAGPRAAWHPR
jgi:hypothetical protein